MLYGCLYSRSKLLTGTWIIQLGKISYGLYLLHLTGLLLAKSFIHPVSGTAQLATKAVGFVLTVVLAFASYRWVESPFLRLKDRFARVLSRPV
jgi:peptidoglycan/LPS O-acetylase OafA/YrhL